MLRRNEEEKEQETSKEEDIHQERTLEKEEINPTISCNALALYGYHAPSITLSLRENSKVQSVEDHIEHQQQVLKILKDNLTLAQNRMKQ